MRIIPDPARGGGETVIGPLLDFSLASSLGAAVDH